jgi:hypothetical protein
MIAKLFGVAFPMKIEPSVFSIASLLADSYNGGFWEFYMLSNGGFYMAPKQQFEVRCPNQHTGTLTGDAFGLVCCMYVYSHCSFDSDKKLSALCTRHYHRLRDYALQHAEANAILQAID